MFADCYVIKNLQNLRIKKEPDEHLVIRPFTEINYEKSHQLKEILTDIPLRAPNFK